MTIEGILHFNYLDAPVGLISVQEFSPTLLFKLIKKWLETLGGAVHLSRVRNRFGLANYIRATF